MDALDLDLLRHLEANPRVGVLELSRLIGVSRATAHITYPARFQLVAAMNPCRCGYLGEGGRECGRAPRCGEDYRNRVSGPVLDRIDLAVDVQPVGHSVPGCV